MKRELEFSLIGEVKSPIAELLEEFERTHQVHVRVRLTNWQTAWQELVGYSLYGNEPHVSHLGSTWVSSLMRMNALRPFSASELKAAGGKDAFLPPCWQSIISVETSEAWAMPWTAYTFLINYRRDFLERAGIDEKQAFTSAESLAQTLAQLSNAGYSSPWVVPASENHTDTLHYVASWIWGAGGDIVSSNGRVPLFAKPEAMDGLLAYYSLYRYLPPDAPALSAEQAYQLFWQGKSAVMISGVDEPYILQAEGRYKGEVFENLGVAMMPGVPWIGGDDLVIWRRSQDSMLIEKAAVALVNFLTCRRSQKVYCGLIPNHHTPTRLDVLPDLPLPDSQLTQAVVQSLRSGRSYPPISLWGRVENQLSSALNRVWVEIFAGKDPETALHDLLDPLARQLRLTLGG
ncbi:MAG: extracellular solute-binding protein [Anaerolineales bacterium]|nr:extracellular solute-binding protein [Anaerolineales bacterium]